MRCKNKNACFVKSISQQLCCVCDCGYLPSFGIEKILKIISRYRFTLAIPIITIYGYLYILQVGTYIGYVGTIYCSVKNNFINFN